MEALDGRSRSAQAGLGDWGTNLVRNIDDLADLTLALRRDAERRSEQFAQRFPNARVDRRRSTSCSTIPSSRRS